MSEIKQQIRDTEQVIKTHRGYSANTVGADSAELLILTNQLVIMEALQKLLDRPVYSNSDPY